MKLWHWFGRKSQAGDEPDTVELEKVETQIQQAEEKLAETMAQLPELSRAVASARRVKYRVDTFTKESYDGARGVSHG